MSLPFLLSIAIPVCYGHMSLNFPNPRDNNGTHATWQMNEPMVPVYPAVCHGLPADETLREGNTFTLGETIDIVFNVDTRHGGGHCAFWYSTDDETFTKIVDVKDCTLAEVGARVQLPGAMPAECATQCTFAFSWVPLLSGACEIYMTCADIRVVGATGGAGSNVNTKNFQTAFIDHNGCQRVDDHSHWTPIFMPLVTADSDGQNDAFTENGKKSSHSTTRTMVFVAVFAVAWCLVVAGWMCFCRRKRRRASELERKRMTATLEESHQIARAEVDVEVSVEMADEIENERERERATNYELDHIDVTKSSPSV